MLNVSASNLYIPPSPIPLVVAPQTPILSVILAEEVKDPEVTYPVEGCNCYAYVKNRIVELPPMAAINPNVEPSVGSVAVEYFGKVKHVSIVTKIEDSGVWVEEANYNHCKTGERFIPFTKHSLVGFWSAG